MPEYLHPGVYIEEIERGPRPIEGVPTSTARDRTTMTLDDILYGRLICEIGIAPVRPAEFVVFRIFQSTAESQR